MKRLIVVTVLFSLFLMGCDGVLSVVTVNENGEKIFLNYISIISDTVYDATVSIKNWKDMELLKDDDFSSENILFTIVSEKEKIIVLGNSEYAIEIKIFDGGYKYTAFMSADGLSEAFKL